MAMTVPEMKLEIQNLGNEDACLRREIPELVKRLEYMNRRLLEIPGDVDRMKKRIAEWQEAHEKEKAKNRVEGRKKQIEKKLNKLQRELERA